MNTQSRDLRRQRAALIQEMHDLTERSSFPEEAQRRWKDLDRQQKELEQRIMKLESEELDEQMRQVTPPPPSPLAHAFPSVEQNNFSDSRELRPFEKELSSREYREAFNGFLRGGDQGLNSRQRNLLADLSTEVRTYTGLNTSTSGDAAGYTIPIGFQRELETRLKAYSQMRKICRILNTATGNTLDWPTMDDTGNSGEFLSEASPVNQVNPTFGQVQFHTYLASSKQVLLSVQILQDSAFDLESTLAEAFAIRIGRIVNTKYTLGNGTTEPQGLITAIKADTSPNIVNATGANSNTGNNGDTEENMHSLTASAEPLRKAARVLRGARRTPLQQAHGSGKAKIGRCAAQWTKTR